MQNNNNKNLTVQGFDEDSENMPPKLRGEVTDADVAADSNDLEDQLTEDDDAITTRKDQTDNGGSKEDDDSLKDPEFPEITADDDNNK